MKRLLKSMLLVAAVLVGQNAWADETQQLAAVNFSDAQWSQYNIENQMTFDGSKSENTVNSIIFKGYKTNGFYVDNGELVFPGSNMSDNYYMGIPLSNINGVLTITINCPYTKNAYYRYEFASDGKKTSTCSTSDKCDGNGNITISISDLTSASGTLFIGRGSSTYPQISSVTVTTPSGSTETAPSFKTGLPSTADVYVGVATTFTVAASGNPTPTYQWYKDNVALSGETGASYTYTATSEGSAKIYCVASNSQGNATSATCTVTATVCNYLVKAVVTGATSADVAGTMTGATADVNLNATGKLSANGKYFGIKAPTGQNFQQGDVVKIHLTTAGSQGGGWYAFSSSTASSETLIYSSTEDYTATDLSFSLTSSTNAIYFVRSDTYTWNPTFGYIQVERPQTVSVTITDAGRATLYSDQKLVVPTGVTAYTYLYDSNTGTLVRGTEINAGSVLPANTGYVIKGDPNTYNFTVSSGTAENVTSSLTGSTSAMTADGATYYGLNVDDNGKFDFYLLENGTTIPAGRAVYVKTQGN